MDNITIEVNAEKNLGKESEILDPTRRLHREMSLISSSATTKPELLESLAELLDCFASPTAMFYIPRNEKGEFAKSLRLRPHSEDEYRQRYLKQVMSAAQTSCRTGEVTVWQNETNANTIFTVPIASQGSDPEVLGVIYATERPTSHYVMLLQLIASHIVLWHELNVNHHFIEDIRNATALIELTDRITTAPDLRHACYSLAGELATYFQSKRVAVGLITEKNERCRLHAVSGIARFDKWSPATQAIEAAMDEAIIRKELTQWPSLDEKQRHALLAHKNLCTQEDVNTVFSTPLRDQDGKLIGALVILDDSDVIPARTLDFLKASESHFANSLSVAGRLQGGSIQQLLRSCSKYWYPYKGIAALVIIVFLLSTMMLPLKYKVHCNCRIEPVLHRFVAAPFEGILEKSLVTPGELVHKNDVIARMDGREVRWERAGVVAQRDQELKRRDAAQASHNYSEQQIAQLEIERLDLKLQLLDYRAENLEIKSPVDGIVTGGDLERAEGSPITVGQTLFEIAPLEAMIVEAAIPDNEISHIRNGQILEVRLDAYSDQKWQTVVSMIQPRSEIREETNVFICEGKLDNSEYRLRPGMKGRAKVETSRRPIGWILFHKPYEYLTKSLSW